MKLNDLKEIYKQRLMNLIEKRGDDQVFELSMEIIDSIESSYKLNLTSEQVKILEDIAETYKETGVIL
jgi:hypothetical protein